MVQIDTTVDINRPPEEVFSYLTDPTKLHEWQGGVVESRQETEGPMGVGSRITDIRKFLGKRMESVVEVVGYDEGKRFDIQVISGPVPFRVEHRLDPQGTGGTRLMVHAQGEPGGFFKFAEAMVGRQAQRQFDTDFATLKDILESQ